MEPALHPFQTEALDLLRSGGHVICVAPTGAGKSLIFQRHTQQEKARTLILSPLVALARQHAERLADQKIPVSIHCGGAHEPPPPSYGAWILSPESLLLRPDSKALARLRDWAPTLLVMDECHCLWEWGEFFRPCLERIPRLIQDPGVPRSLWLTATLPQAARDDLRRRLPPPVREVGSFSLPPGLKLRTFRVPPELRWDCAGDIVRRRLGRRGILFAPTRAHVERWRRWLAAQKIRVVPYHAGMGREERASAERAVRSGWCQIVVATSAFGMGMDFAGLEWMISTHAPPSLLALAQAAGRVARAGAEGTAVVLWHPTDFRIYDRGKGSDRRTAEMVSALRALESGPQPIEELNRYFS